MLILRVVADDHVIHKKEEKNKQTVYRKSSIYANEIGKKNFKKITDI